MKKVILTIIIFLLLVGCQSNDESPIETNQTSIPDPTSSQNIIPTNEPNLHLNGSGGGLIVFENEEKSDYNYELFVMNADGSELTKLTDNPAFDGAPSFSPDVKKFAFTSTRNGNMNVFIFNLEAYIKGEPTEAIQLTDEGNNYCPAWAPDNSSIVFTSDRDGGFKIYKMNIDGSDEEIFIDLDGAFYPSWSSDSKKLVFNAKANGTNEIYSIDATGENIVRLTNNSVDDQFASWSPDGENIAYSSSDSITLFDIYTMDKNGESIVKLIASGNSDEFPIWSPDGTQILCRSSITGSDQLIIMDKDGSNVRAITNLPGVIMDCDWKAIP